MQVAASAYIVKGIVGECEKIFVEDTTTHIFPSHLTFCSPRHMVHHILDCEARINKLLKFLLESTDEEIATQATLLSSSLATLKFGVAKKISDSATAGI